MDLSENDIDISQQNLFSLLSKDKRQFNVNQREHGDSVVKMMDNKYYPLSNISGNNSDTNIFISSINNRENTGVIKNGQSRETGNIGYTRHRTATNKTNNTTQKTKTMSNTATTPKNPPGSKQEKWLVSEEIKIRNANVMMCSSLLKKEDKSQVFRSLFVS